jgi:hypothetical protein
MDHGRPAPPSVAYSPEPGFILKEYFDTHTIRSICYGFLDDDGEFFLNSS